MKNSISKISLLDCKALISSGLAFALTCKKRGNNRPIVKVLQNIFKMKSFK